MFFMLVFLGHRANEVRIHGVRYKNTAVIRVKTPHQDNPFLYGSIRDIYVYKDKKIFILVQLHVEKYCDHLRAVQVTRTDQIILCIIILYDFYYHGVLHTKSIGASVYIVDIEHYYN